MVWIDISVHCFGRIYFISLLKVTSGDVGYIWNLMSIFSMTWIRILVCLIVSPKRYFKVFFEIQDSNSKYSARDLLLGKPTCQGGMFQPQHKSFNGFNDNMCGNPFEGKNAIDVYETLFDRTNVALYLNIMLFVRGCI